MSRSDFSGKYQKAPRFSFGWYGISQERYRELRDGCASGRYSLEILSKACAGFEHLMPWVLLSVTKCKSWDKIEYSELGRIPVGRSDFYGFRRRFYHNLDVILREECSA